jgi:bromodomain-containing protein 9
MMIHANIMFFYQVGFQLQQSYPRSLARFAAQLGPVGWEIASGRIERSLPPRTKFGHGWVGDVEAPKTFQPPVSASLSEAVVPPSNITASDEQPIGTCPATMDGAVSASHLVGSQPHAVSYASSTSAGRSVDSQELPVQQCESVPQISMDPGGHGVEMKGNYNRHEHPSMQQTDNGFNAVPGAKPDSVLH